MQRACKHCCLHRRWNDGRTQLILLEPKQSTMPHRPASADGVVRGLERAAMVPWGPRQAAGLITDGHCVRISCQGLARCHGS